MLTRQTKILIVGLGLLGGSYAIGNILAEKLGIPMEEVTFHLLTAPETREMVTTPSSRG